MLNELALCSGIGGISLGLERAGLARAVCHVEIDPYAVGVLITQMEAGCLTPAPIWDDLRTFDGAEWRGVVDIVTAGYPCQPFSVAGKRQGEADPRHLWPQVRRIVDEVEPGIVLLENVPGHIRLGFDRVLADLAEGGFDAEWDCIPASAVGAHFIGDRLFVLASRAPADISGPQGGGAYPLGTGPWRRDEFERLVRAALESGVPAGKHGRLSDGVPSRVDRLRCLGNAVVPQVAEYIGRRIRGALSMT